MQGSRGALLYLMAEQVEAEQVEEEQQQLRGYLRICVGDVLCWC